MQSNNLLTGEFRNAVKDYYYLINRNYPERGSLKLIGDRYRLDRDQRTILYRGISDQTKADNRCARLVNNIKGKNIIIDGYNVLFTLLNYRLGRILFISYDNILRDAGSLHGKLRGEKLFLECTEQLIKNLLKISPEYVQIYIDSPVSHSAKHCRMLNSLMKDRNLPGNCEVVRSADFLLKNSDEGILATSDSVIIDKTTNPIVDLPSLILGMKNNFLNLKMLI